VLQRNWLVFSLIWSSVFVALGFNSPDAKATPQESELTDANFAQWQNRLKAKHSELQWQDLPWLTSFHEGLQQAAAEGKPLLLWVMNGHPLGCT
jgi:hypothetical protein